MYGGSRAYKPAPGVSKALYTKKREERHKRYDNCAVHEAERKDYEDRLYVGFVEWFHSNYNY